MIIRKLKNNELKKIFELAKQYDLESDDMHADQFIVAEIDGEIAGFGRLVKHNNCIELGTIGVVEKFRGKKIATKLINELINIAKQNGYKTIYLTTLIPEFFKKFGFEIQKENPPDCMIRTKEWCDGCKKVGCTVMKKDI